MASSPSFKNNRISIGTNRSYAAANAPEIDHALLAPEYDHTALAPEYRGDNAPPEVDPSRGVQVFYDNSAPEAIEIKSTSSSEAIGALPGSDPAPAQNSKKWRKALILVILAAVVVVAALGTGLGVGLPQRAQRNAIANSPSSPTIPGNSSTATVSVSILPSATGRVTNRVFPNALRNNTALAAVTLPKGNRHVYFQDRTGAIRRAIFAAESKLWQASAEEKLIVNAKNNTPLAAVADPPSDYPLDVTTVFYVDAKSNAIRCVAWKPTDTADCNIFDDTPDMIVAPDCQHIGVFVLLTDEASGNFVSLVLTYQAPSNEFVMRTGYRNSSSQDWTWSKDKSEDFQQTAIYLPQDPGRAHVAAACTPKLFGVDYTAYAPEVRYTYHFYCFVKKDSGLNSTYAHDGGVASFQFYMNLSKPDNLITDFGGNFDSRVDYTPKNFSDIVLLSSKLGFDNHALWLNGSRLEGNTDLTSVGMPRTAFPFQRLAGTYAANSTKTYLYHQLDDSTLAEEFWDDAKSTVWFSNNITIEVA
ncbi:MAG: hypothetical protein Q9207_006216 [Kuettlingeria erythrocarpa]